VHLDPGRKPARRRYRLAITGQHQQILLDDSPTAVHELHPPQQAHLLIR
jgi:hypothetical protein